MAVRMGWEKKRRLLKEYEKFFKMGYYLYLKNIFQNPRLLTQ